MRVTDSEVVEAPDARTVKCNKVVYRVNGTTNKVEKGRCTLERHHQGHHDVVASDA